METLRKNKLAVVMVFVLVVALVLSPMISMAGSGDNTQTEGSYDQIGKYVDVDKNGDTKVDQQYDNPEQKILDGTKDELYVKYGKSITGTAVANEFEITLDIETNEKISDIYVPSNLMIVMDVSTSMDQPQYKVDGKTRWERFKPATQALINDFMSHEGNSVSLAVFAGQSSKTDTKIGVHKNICDWTTSKAAVLKSFDKTSASDLRSSSGIANNDQYTNGQAAFRAALEGVKSANMPNQYTSIIVVTDGDFNRSYTSGDGSDTTKCNASATTESALITKYADEEASNPIDLYTMGIGASPDPINPAKNINIKQLFVADDNDISTVLGNLYKSINSTVQCWTVTDPMSKWVNFGAVTKAQVATTAAFNTTDKILTWDVRNDNPVSITGDKGSGYVYKYQLKYTVTLDTSDTSALREFDKWDNFVPTNKETTLVYGFVYNDKLNTDTAKFRIPTVKASDPTPKTKKLAITKTVVGDTNGESYNKNQEFTFVIPAGEGNLDVKGYTVIDEETGQEHRDTDNGEITIKAGQKAVLDCDFIVGEEITVKEIKVHDDYICNNLDNEETVTIDGDEDVVFANFTNTYKQPFIAKGEIAAVKSANPTHGSIVTEGENITYTITVTNNKNTTAEGILVRDSIPANTTFVSAADDGDYVEGEGYVEWYIDEIPVGETADVSFTVKVNSGLPEGTQILNAAKYQEIGPLEEGKDPEFTDPKPTNDVIHNTEPAPIPTFSITKTNTPDESVFVSGGEVITYDITVKNTGEVDIDNLWIKDTVPANTTFKDFVGDNTGTRDGSTLMWNISSLPVDGSQTVSFTVTVNEGLPGATKIINIAYASDLPGGDTPGDSTEWVPSNPVDNLTPEVLPEEADPKDPIDPKDPKTPGGTVKGDEDYPDGDVLGETADPAGGQKVLGQEAKTSDAVNMMIPYLVLAAIAVMAVLTLTIVRMRRKED